MFIYSGATQYKNYKNICDGALCDWFNENAGSILTKQFRLIISLDTDRMIREYKLYVGHKTLRI